jgi:accessory secretory protein Asp3
MAENLIYWTPQTQRLEPALTVTFERLDSVIWRNELVLSGQSVVRWSSRGQADLPVVKPGERYILRRVVQQDERMFVYVVVQFYDRNGQVLWSETRDEEEMILQVPYDTAYWTIDLQGAGTGEINFNYLTLRESMPGILTEIDQRLTQSIVYQTAPQQHQEMLRVIFVEPNNRQLMYPDMTLVGDEAVLMIADERPLANFYLPDDEQIDYDATVKTLINDTQKKYRAKKLVMVGYGPISSYAALRFAKQLKAEAWVSEDALEHPKMYFYHNLGQWQQQAVRLSQSAVTLAVVKSHATEFLRDLPYLSPTSAHELLAPASRVQRLKRLGEMDKQRALSRQLQPKKGFFKRR